MTQFLLCLNLNLVLSLLSALGEPGYRHCSSISPASTFWEIYCDFTGISCSRRGRNIRMEEKSVMSKLKKLSSKRQMQEIVKYTPGHVNKRSTYSHEIYDSVPFGVISVDSLGRIQYMNRVAKLLLGEPDQALLPAQWPQ